MGCSSSKNVEVYSTKAARPEEQNSLENGHLVALTSSSFGLLSLDSQKKSEDPKKEVDDPVNQMYMRMMNLDAPGSQLPQSWSEVSNVLSKLKSEAQSKARPGVRGEPETVDVSELLDEDVISKAPPPQEVVEKPKLEKEGPKKKRDTSVIHTLEEVDKLAIVPVESPDESESDDDFQPPFYSSNSNRSRNQRFSLSVRSRAPSTVKDSQKSSKSLSSQSSTLFDEEFLESFKEAFEQLSNGVPSTASAPAAAAPPAPAQTKSAGKGNKISSSQLGPNKTTPFKTSSGVNVNEDKPSPTKPVGQRKLKGPDQKLVNSSESPNTRNNKLKQSNSVGQEESPETNTTNKPKRSILKHKEAPEINKVTGTNKVKLPQQEEKQPETTKPVNRFKNQEVFELNKSSRQKEIPVFSNKKTAPAPAPVKPPPSEPSLLLQLPRKCPPEGENKVVLYSTSLRGIRKTFEDCNSVRSLLQSFNVEIDERDVSMDSNYRQELRDLMDKPVAVPRVFIKGRYVGGAEEVVGIHETGGLEKMLQGIPRGNLSKDCDGCGGMRFIPCTDCNGSCKAVAEDGRVIKCPDCNENGLVRCPICS